MSHVYNEAKRALLAGEIDWVNDDLRAVIVMSDTTCGTEVDANTMADFSVPDYCDGSGSLSATGSALDTQTVTEDPANDRAQGDTANEVWNPLGASTRKNVGHVIFKWLGTRDASMPILYLDGDGYPFMGNGESSYQLEFKSFAAGQVLRIG